MATDNTVGIKKSWSLRAFRAMYDKMKLTNPMVNKETGEPFRSTAFIDAAGGVTLVGFSSKLGELSAAQIKAQVDELQVVQLNSGSYKLCKAGADTWEDVDI